MTELSRRGFIGIAAAALVRPSAPGPYRRVEVETPSGWEHRPDGLRTVHAGEKFRMFMPNEREPHVVAEACEDGHEVIDERIGKLCGGLECYVESGDPL